MEAGSQKRAPVYEALEQLKKRRVVPFDVPGHKRGRGNPELVELLGEKCVSLDVNSMKPLDNLCHPVSVIKEAEELAAEAFRADHAFFMVGGTTSSVQSMVLSVCRAGDKIILPRNVHKSVINALVLCGAIPVYVNPEVDKKLGISLGMEISEVERAILENPGAVAVLVNNPTYYGICSDLRSIVKLAHEHEMLVLVDEAHGTHLYFGEDLPVCAMDAGADMASVSMHKSGGSLTLGVCQPDYQPHTDDKRVLSSDVKSRYLAEKSGAARKGIVPQSGGDGGIRQGGDQRHRRILCLRQGYGERRKRL